MTYLLPDWAYDILKWTGLVFLPALAVLVAHVGPEWGIPNVNRIVVTITEIGLFIGTLIGASQLSATPKADE